MRQLVKLNLLLVAFLIVASYTPIMKLFFPPTFLFGVGFVCFILTIISSENTQIVFNRQTTFWFILYAWQLACVLIGHSDADINYIIVRFLVYLIPLLVPYVFYVCNVKEKRFIAVIIFLTLLANVLYNIYFGVRYPIIYEYSGQYEDGFKIANNISDTILATCSIFFIPICYIIVRNTSRRFFKIFLWIVIIADIALLLFVIQRATALFVMIVQAAVLLMVDRGVRFKRALTIGVFLIGFGFVMLGSSWGNTFLLWFEGSEKLTYRMTQVVDFAQSGAVDESTFSGRLSLSKLSINTFFGGLDNFFVGVGEDERVVEILGLESSGVGHHSEFFDLAARYGVVGIFLVFMALSRSFKFIISQCSNRKLVDRARIVFLFYVIYSFLNNTFNTEVFFLIFMFLPITIWLIDEKSKSQIYV